MHGEGMADQGLDVAAAYDSVNAEMKELCMLRMGLGREFAEMQNEFDMGDKLLVLTGYGVSDEVCREWEALEEEEKPWQRHAPAEGMVEEWRENKGVGVSMVGFAQGGAHAPSAWNGLMDVHACVLEKHGTDPVVMRVEGSEGGRVPEEKQKTKSGGAIFADDMRLQNNTMRGAQVGCDIAADVQAVMGLLMQCAKGWGRGMAGVATHGNGRWGGGGSVSGR
jgi:hypothetical protein